jgi:hypothetical protein
MNALHDDLLYVLDAIEIESPTRYRLSGAGRASAQAGPDTATGEGESKGFVESLANAIYETLYSRPCTSATTAPRVDDWTDLTMALSAANRGKGTWEPGWIVDRFDTAGSVVVTKNGVSFWVSGDGLRAESGNAPEAGESCRVRVPNERRNESPGYYTALGDADGAVNNPSGGKWRLVRYYWHLTDRIATEFVGRSTAMLNGSKIPFRLKVLSDARAYTRADAGVLYVSSHDQPALAVLLPELYSAVSAGLRRPVPMFTKRLADGLGFAEDPGNLQSFGQHRSQLVAEALWRSYCRGEFDREARAATMASTFVEAGLDPLEPHLGANSPLKTAGFATPFAAPITPLVRVSSAERDPESPVEFARGPFLAAAARIGAALCESAFWNLDGRLCNWIGCTDGDSGRGSGSISHTAQAIGHDVYDGSAGIALFLAQLAEITGERKVTRTAAGAVLRSLRQIGRVGTTVQASPVSFYSGELGVAWTARKVGQATQNPGLVAASGTILNQIADSVSLPHDLDLIGGNAGAVPVLFALGREAGMEHCRELAIRLGEELLRTAVPQDVGCAWPQQMGSGSNATTAPLTGFSHGAAGIGRALFEVYLATGRSDFLECARHAFAYEDSLFEPSERNWPGVSPDDGGPAYHVLWCHGAPGIALSRLRAALVDPDRADLYLAKARLGLATTLDAIEQSVESPRWDTCLCHGLAGLGEVILIAGQMLKDPVYTQQAEDLGRALIERYGESGKWPSGIPSGGPNPSLMIGLAGVGHWFLRLHDPAAVPSVLLLKS